jgi:hypothetical protein
LWPTLAKGAGFRLACSRCRATSIWSHAQIFFGNSDKGSATKLEELCRFPGYGIGKVAPECGCGRRAASPQEPGRVARLGLSRCGLGHAVQAQCCAPSSHIATTSENFGHRLPSRRALPAHVARAAGRTRSLGRAAAGRSKSVPIGFGLLRGHRHRKEMHCARDQDWSSSSNV